MNNVINIKPKNKKYKKATIHDAADAILAIMSKGEMSRMIAVFDGPETVGKVAYFGVERDDLIDYLKHLVIHLEESEYG